MTIKISKLINRVDRQLQRNTLSSLENGLQVWNGNSEQDIDEYVRLAQSKKDMTIDQTE